PRQMELGAIQDPGIIYQYAHLVGSQCKRMGIQVNFAPVVDINNNPDNPVINDRSFGEDKNKVAQYGLQYMLGLQGVGIMEAKHILQAVLRNFILVFTKRAIINHGIIRIIINIYHRRKIYLDSHSLTLRSYQMRILINNSWILDSTEFHLPR